MNIGAGYFAITQTIEAASSNAMANGAQMHLDWAAIAILLAIPFDSLGWAHRADDQYGERLWQGTGFACGCDYVWCGAELAGVCVGISFSVRTPSIRSCVSTWSRPERFICFLFLIGGASRLARFNISHDPKPRNPGRPDRKYFVGMPIPAAAGLLAATVHFFYGIPVQAWWVAIPVVGPGGAWPDF